MKKYFSSTPAVFAIFRESNTILLTRRFQTGWMDGNYSVPSGHFEGNESPRQCIAREIEEEVGVEVQLNDLRFAHVVYRKESDPDADERIDFFFEVIRYTGNIHNAEPDKCDDIDWFDVEDLPKNTVPVIKKVIEAMAEGKHYSSYGLGE